MKRMWARAYRGSTLEWFIADANQTIPTDASPPLHYDDVIMGTIAPQITSLTIVYSTVYSGADKSKHQSSASLAFVWGIHRGPVNSPHKWPVTRKMFPFDDVIMRITMAVCLRLFTFEKINLITTGLWYVMCLYFYLYLGTWCRYQAMIP